MIWQSLINFSPQQNFSEINKKLILRKEKFDILDKDEDNGRISMAGKWVRFLEMPVIS